MATCKDCIHYDICICHLTGKENEKCAQFLNKADVVRVKHGHWEPYGINPNGVIGNYHCTVCKGTSLKDSDYCPNCGAVMDEKE